MGNGGSHIGKGQRIETRDEHVVCFVSQWSNPCFCVVVRHGPLPRQCSRSWRTFIIAWHVKWLVRCRTAGDTWVHLPLDSDLEDACLCSIRECVTHCQATLVQCLAMGLINCLCGAAPCRVVVVRHAGGVCCGLWWQQDLMVAAAEEAGAGEPGFVKVTTTAQLSGESGG